MIITDFMNKNLFISYQDILIDMNSVLSFLLLLLPSYFIKYEKENFYIKTPQKTYQVESIEKKINNLPLSLYKDKEITLSWDAKGLTLEKTKNKRVFSFQDALLAKELFSRNEINQNIQKIKSNRIKRTPSELLGHAILQDQLYLLLRWHDQKSKPWFDALIELDLSARRPYPKYKRIISGIDLNFNVGQSALITVDKDLYFIRGFKEDWGIFSWNPSKELPEKKDFQKLGTGLLDWSYLSDKKQLIIIEKTVYGTNLISLTHFSPETKKPLAESRGKASICSTRPFITRLDQPHQQSLRMMETGADLILQPNMKIKILSDNLILIWSEGKEPCVATLYHSKNWKVLASWKRSH